MDFGLILWTLRLRRNTDVLLLDKEDRDFIPHHLFRLRTSRFGVSMTVSHRHHKQGYTWGILYLKRFVRLYDYHLASQDVLLVDDSVEKKSTNSPFSAFHPESFTPWTEVHVACGPILA
ncbi:hypothetical protein R1sor_001443 [Riccia sorocarpa]|uniref:FCP1 homology domain-containing protein n=1 Tax=Riccia sorocarpa TaxID=122646 RepID=A0ABD3GXL5_9MARC